MNPIENDVIKKAIKWRKQIKKKVHVMSLKEWQLYQAVTALEKLYQIKPLEIKSNKDLKE